MCVTGVLLAYAMQLIRWADIRGYAFALPADGAARLPLEALLAQARAGQTAAPTAVTLYGDAAEPATVTFPGGRNLFVNPYTGAVFGEGAPRVRAFFRTVTDWH